MGRGRQEPGHACRVCLIRRSQMADNKQEKHEKALDLTEAALDSLVTGDEAKADKLIEEAKKLDPSALKEVVEDLAEAEGSSGTLDDQVQEEEDEEAAG